MASSNVSDMNHGGNWFTRIFSSKQGTSQLTSPTNRMTSITNPTFESFGEILRSKRTTEYLTGQKQNFIEQSLVDISVNAESDYSNLADKSRGTKHLFNTSQVCATYLLYNIICLWIDFYLLDCYKSISRCSLCGLVNN